MATLAAMVRITIPNAATWRDCGTCGKPTSLPADATHCTRRRKTRRS